ncbi:hypothetical protein FRC01_011479 [Tulasnella sp. 417]|nr:hypothetical protein FRC01_011479 [Tulasnella sp. 417]
MASNLQTVLPNSLETALAVYVTPGQIDSKSTLEAAILDLLVALQIAYNDVATLLTAITRKVDGLLEVIIASRNELAFGFRSRVLNALQYSAQYPDPIFITCTERIGAFLISIPPWISVDQNIMAKHREFSAKVLSMDAEPEYFVKKPVEPTENVLIESTRTNRSGKRQHRATSGSSAVQRPGRQRTRDQRASTAVVKQPPSPSVITNHYESAMTIWEELNECLVSYFDACLEDDVEEIAPQEGPGETVAEISPSPVEDLAQAPAGPLSRTTTALHDIFCSLGDATRPKLGQWLVVVSQLGIKHIRNRFSQDRDTFARIENTMRYYFLLVTRASS